MVEFRIDVVANATGFSGTIRQVEGRLSRAENAANRFRRTVVRAFAVGVLVRYARQLARVADEFSNLQNRLRTVTRTQADLNAVTERLLDVSNATRTSLQTNAELYQRLAGATTNLGLSQNELLDITKSLNQAVTLSGVTAVEAANSIRQFTQGLGSGELRGQELRSVLEQLPVVADVIAKELGVARGELIRLGEDGAISSDILISALQNASQELEQGFGETVPTLEQSFIALTNSFGVFVGQLDKATGVTEEIAKAFLEWARIVREFPQVLATLLEPVAEISDAVTGLFRGLLNATVEIFMALADEPEAAFNLIEVAARDVVEGMLDVFVAFLTALNNSFIRTFSDIGNVIGNTGAALGAISVGNFDAAAALSGNIEESLALATRNITDFGAFFRSELEQLVRTDFLDPVEFTPKGRNLGEDVAGAFAQGFVQSTAARDIIQGLFAGIIPGLGSIGGSTEGADLDAPPTTSFGGGADPNALLRRQQELLDSILEPQREYNLLIADLNRLFAEGAISQEQFTAVAEEGLRRVLESANTAEAGLERAFQSLRIEAADLASVVEQSVDIGLNGAVDAASLGLEVLAGRVDDAGEAFKALGLQAVQQLQQILLRLLLVQAASALLPGAGAAPSGGVPGGGSIGFGGFFGSFIPGRQGGGPVQAGSPFVVGEDGPELFVPRQAGSIAPNEQLAAAKPEVNVMVINQSDPNEVRNQIASGELDDVIVNRMSQNRSALKSAGVTR